MRRECAAGQFADLAINVGPALGTYWSPAFYVLINLGIHRRRAICPLRFQSPLFLPFLNHPQVRDASGPLPRHTHREQCAIHINCRGDRHDGQYRRIKRIVANEADHIVRLRTCSLDTAIAFWFRSRIRFGDFVGVVTAKKSRHSILMSLNGSFIRRFIKRRMHSGFQNN